MKQETKRNKSARIPKVVFAVCVIVVVIYVLYQRGYISMIDLLYQGEEMTLQHQSDIIEMDATKQQEFIVNDNQVIWITQDGVKAFSLQGEESWADTHTIKNIAIAQRSPYFVVGEKMGHMIRIFDTYGKKADITSTNPIVYFSINRRGEVVVIESTKDGHVVSGYNERGNSLGIKRITYIEDVGYPIAAEISPDGKVIIISYLNTNGVKISSNVVGVALGDEGVTKVDNILYGTTYEDTVISEIEFINDRTWIAVGDNRMIFNTINGQEINKVENTYFSYAPVLERLVDSQGNYYATISSTKPLNSTVHPVQQLAFYSQQGEKAAEITLNDDVSYMYGDGKITVVGDNRTFTAYSRLGKRRWQYTATKDIQKVIPLHSGQQVVVVSKGKVELMEVVK